MVEPLIHVIRGQKVMLDMDLAQLYGVPTKRLNEAVKRNLNRFPARFMFQLSAEEANRMWSQIATTSKRRVTFQPLAFTEHGVVMLSAVLRSARADYRVITPIVRVSESEGERRTAGTRQLRPPAAPTCTLAYTLSQRLEATRLFSVIYRQPQHP
ncbi:MAG TPA: ORF6N domain-containing protein [Granulicella sp.]|nr:ORF6N domain-containing protein [Granulicella sp.]